MDIFLVGGPIRDILMGKENVDIDIAVGKDIKRIGEKIAEELKGKFIFFPGFLTGKIKMGKFVMDIAQIRREFYPLQGKLPITEPAKSIYEDLKRRDFTINSIAMDLKREKIIDPFGGVNDIKEKKIKVLHPKSFKDDPTRIFRAIRFKIRFGFNYEKKTKKLLKEAIEKCFLQKLSWERILHELKLISEEKRRIGMIKEMHRLGIAKRLFPRPFRIKWRFLKRLKGNEFYLFYLSHFNLQIPLSTQEEKVIENMKKYFKIRRNLKRYKRNSSVYFSLEKFTPKTLKIITKFEPDKKIKQKIGWFLKNREKIKNFVTGEDLKNMEIPPGPLYKKILLSIITNMADGRIRTKSEALRYIERRFK